MPESTHKILESSELDDWQRAMLFQNIQRSRLSNERNFLNWVRTSLALITLGFVVQRFDLLMQELTNVEASVVPAGITLWVPLLFFTLGGVLVALGSLEFFRVRREINRGHFGRISWIRDMLIVMTQAFMLIVLVIFIAENL